MWGFLSLDENKWLYVVPVRWVGLLRGVQVPEPAAGGSSGALVHGGACRYASHANHTLALSS